MRWCIKVVSQLKLLNLWSWSTMTLNAMYLFLCFFFSVSRQSYRNSTAGLNKLGLWILMASNFFLFRFFLGCSSFAAFCGTWFSIWMPAQDHRFLSLSHVMLIISCKLNHEIVVFLCSSCINMLLCCIAI